MLKLGDKVRFVNEPMEGIVTSVKDKNMVGVTIESDFEIPVLISEVVKIRFDEKAGNNPSEQIQASKPFRAASSNPLGVFCAFERKGDDEVIMQIHNNLCDFVVLNLFQKDQGVYHLIRNLNIERDETVKFGTYQISGMNKWPALFFQILPVEHTTVKPSIYVETEITFQAKKFHQWLKYCFFLNTQAYMFRLDEPAQLSGLQALKEKDFTEKSSVEIRNLKDKPSGIIDLHFDSLKANGYGSATDITSFQMDVFIKTLEAAFVHHMKEIVYIHGVGNAYLKNKIRTWLSKHPEFASSWEDADILKFGDGATLVRLK